MMRPPARNIGFAFFRRLLHPLAEEHALYTTNAVEALHRSLRKIIKTRGSFPNDDAALKLLYLAIKNAAMRWRRGIEWTAAMGQFAIQFGERFPGTARCGGRSRSPEKGFHFSQAQRLAEPSKARQESPTLVASHAPAPPLPILRRR
jgi:hypothetical protein